MSEDSWYQQSLTPPTVLELNVRVGMIPEQDHLQALVEIKDPMTGVLLGQASYPHTSMRDLELLVEWIGRKVIRLIDDNVDPFPD